MCCCSSISCSHDGSNSKCGWPYVIDTTPDLQRKWDTFLDGRAAAAPKLSGLQPSSGQLSSHTLSYLAPSRQQQQQQFQNPAQLQQHCPFNPPPTHHADNDAILQLLGGGSLCSSPAFTPPAATPSQPPVTNTTWLMQHTPRADHAATASKPAATLHAAANTATPHCMAGCSKDTVARPGMHVSAHSSRLASHGGCGRPGMRVADLSTLSPKALLQSPAPETVQPAAAGGPWDEASQPWLPPRRQQYHQQQQRHQQHERLQIQEHFELPQQQQQQQQKHQQQPSGPWQGQQQQLLHPPAATASSRALQSSHQSTVEAPANEPRTSLQHGPEAQQQQQVLAQQRTLHPQHQQVQQQQQFQQHKKQQQQHFQQRNQQQQQQRCQQQLHSLGNCMSRPGQPGAIAGGAMQGSTSHASLGQAKPALSVLTSTMSYSSQQAAPHQVAGPRGTAEGMLEQQQQQQQQQQQHTRTGQPRWGAVSAAQQHQQLLQLPQGAPAWGDHRADQQPQQQQQQPQQQQQHSAGGGNSWPSITTPWTPQSTTAAAPMQHYPQQQQQQQHSRLLNTSSSSAACPWTEAVDGDLTPNATEPRAIPAGCLPGPAPTSRWAASSTSMQQQLPPVYIPNCAPSSNAAAAAVAAAVQASGKRPAGEAAAAAAASTAQPQVAAKRQKRSTGPAAAASSGGGGGRGATGGRAGAKYGSNVTITCTRPGEAVDPADAAAIAAAIAARGAKQTTLEQSLQRAAAAGGLDAAAAEEEVDPAEDEAGAEEPPRRLTAEERMRRQRVRIRLLKKGGKQLLARVAAAEQARKGKQGSAAAAAGSGGRSAASKGRRQVQLPQGLREGVSEGIVGGSEEPSAAGSRGNNGRRGGSRSSLQRTKAAAEAAAAACREQLQLEQLPQDGSVQLLDGPAAWLAARSALSGAQGCCFGLLHAAECGSAAQYYTSLVGLSKEQQAALRKAAAEQRRAKGKAPAITTSTSSGSPEASSSSSYLAGVAVVPLLPSSHSCSTPAMYIYLLPPAAPGAAAPCLGAAAQQLLEQVLANPQLPCLCCDAKAVLVALQQAGWVVPPADMLQLVDPCVLGWVLESQRVQDAKDSDCYSLLQQLERNGMDLLLQGPSQDCYQLPPLLRLQWQLQQAAHLAVHQQQLLQHMQAPQALKVELKVLGVLARMEALGVCCDPAPLRRHHAHLRTRMAALTARAEQLVGHPINLSSASQLATVLYQELALPAPTVTAGRHAAKTHHSTDEAALQQLSQQHELPGLVLEHRCLLNITSKWLESPWVAALCATADAAASEQQGRAPAAGSTTSGGSAAVPAGCVITAGAAATAAAAGVCGSGAVRGPAGALVGVVRCCWSQVSTATGRLSCSGPNLQAVTKYTVRAHTIPQHAPVQQPQKQQPGGPSSAALEEINIRDAFVAPAGRLLLSADYSQIELRLLAHFSGDSGLLQLLRQAGPAGDVFTAVAARCLKDPITGQMPADARERAKRVTYAIIYGSTPFGLAQQLQQQGVTQAAAQQLISSFLAAFPGVKRFMDSSIAAAAQAGWVTTLLGRRREIGGLCSGDAKERAAAARKVVNTIIQGSAADLIKLAMCAWDDWIHSSSSSSSSSSSGGGGGGSRPPASYTRHTAPTTTSTSSPPVAPAALIAQIHDELLFEVSAGSVADPQFTRVASAVERLMSGAVQLEVPLIVNLTAGQRWGSMVRWQQQQ